jgi:hypothetical protein
MPTFSYTSDTTVSIPANAYDVQITVGGARGGYSSLSGGAAIGNGGAGRAGTFRFKTNFISRTLTIRVGQAGTDSPDTGFYCSAGSSAVGSGGCGGSFGGGQGGGATGVLLNGNLLINAGGGGGGMRDVTVIYESNRTVNYPALTGGNGGDWVANSGSFGFSNGAAAVNSGNLENFYNGGGGGGSFGGSAGFRQRSAYFNNPSTGGGSRYNSNEVDLLSSFTNTGTPFITVSYEVSFVDITSFTANPNPQTSGSDGIPNFDTALSWNVDSILFPLTYTVTSGSFSTSGNTGTSGGVILTNLPQSVAGVTSPATRSYTLTVTDGATTDTASITISAFNDNTPNNYTVPSPTNLEPSTVTTIEVGPITGIDMVTTVTGGSGVSVSNNNINFSSSITISNNQSFFIRATSPPFNTDPNGLTNTASFSVTVGTVQRFFTLSTRAPDVNETFNYSNESDYVPYPDIDTIPDPDADIRNQSNPYIQTDTLLVDDVELGNPYGVEIKSSDPNVQIRVKRFGQSAFSGWQDVRSI